MSDISRGIRRFARDESNVPGVFVVRGYPRRGDRDGVRTRARVVRAEHLTDQTNAHPAAAARRCSADGRLGRKTGSSNERARRAQDELGNLSFIPAVDVDGRVLVARSIRGDFTGDSPGFHAGRHRDESSHRGRSVARVGERRYEVFLVVVLR